MIKVYILNQRFYDLDGKAMRLGGIATYIRMLTELIQKLGMIPIIIQCANESFEREFNGVKVIGVKVKRNWGIGKKSRVLFAECKRGYSDEDIIIFSTHSMNVRNRYKRTIGIHHGLTCDIKRKEGKPLCINMFWGFIRMLKSFLMVLNINRYNYLVAVDYNFLNWYRTKVAYPAIPIHVIPNCTKLMEYLPSKQDDIIKIIFARRFEDYRGTRLFSRVLQRVLDKYAHVYVTFAGSGPDKEFLHLTFSDNKRVNFIEYDSDDSVAVHQDYHIAVIPSMGSEGTSLSLLEAMAAKCAVIATNIGGMTNIILDHYNGILVNPEENEMYEAMKNLIEDKALRENLSQNAIDTVSKAFSRDLWERKWRVVFETVLRRNT